MRIVGVLGVALAGLFVIGAVTAYGQTIVQRVRDELRTNIGNIDRDPRRCRRRFQSDRADQWEDDHPRSSVSDTGPAWNASTAGIFLSAGANALGIAESVYGKWRDLSWSITYRVVWDPTVFVRESIADSRIDLVSRLLCKTRPNRGPEADRGSRPIR